MITSFLLCLSAPSGAAIKPTLILFIPVFLLTVDVEMCSELPPTNTHSLIRTIPTGFLWILVSVNPAEMIPLPSSVTLSVFARVPTSSPAFLCESSYFHSDLLDLWVKSGNNDIYASSSLFYPKVLYHRLEICSG